MKQKFKSGLLQSAELNTRKRNYNYVSKSFDFLNLAVGIKSASKIYFNTTPDSLTIEQAATLVGMAKDPSPYNPLRRIEQTKNRRNTVLHQMVKNNYLSKIVAIL